MIYSKIIFFYEVLIFFREVIIKMKTKRILPLSDNGFDMAHGFSGIQYRQRVDNVMQRKLTNHIFINERNLLFIKIAT